MPERKEEQQKPVLEAAPDQRGPSCPDGPSHGHTPGTAEGEDFDAPPRDEPCVDPGKTPGKAEG